MKIRTVKVGALRTNCYIVTSDTSNEAVIIDPGAQPEKIFEAVDSEALTPVLIINTHAHHDHITANDFLAKKYGIDAAISKEEKELIKEWKSVYFFEFEGIDMDKYFFNKLLSDGDIVTAGGLDLKVILTPGHTKGGICLYSEKDAVLFSGDTLFAGDTGRTDLVGSDPKELKKSLKLLMKLPPETKVYPGHGKATTIGQEKEIYAKS